MPLDQTTQPALTEVMRALPAPAPEYQHCDECGAPVDALQRYCVECGAHRAHVHDPVARHLAQVTVGTRTAHTTPPVPGRRRRRGAGTRGLGTALVLAVIPAVAAAGVVAGRDSSNGDAALIQALARHQTAALAAPAQSAPTTVGTSTTSASWHRSRRAKAHPASTATLKNAGKVVATTQYGSVQQITGVKATKAAQQQGAAATQQVQKSTGKTYVNQQSSLPSQVVVP